jgi:hypothetical protein
MISVRLVLGSVILPWGHIERLTPYEPPNSDRRAGEIETTDRVNASRKSWPNGGRKQSRFVGTDAPTVLLGQPIAQHT